MSGSSIEALDLAALLCSRVCHDLISPVGAIVNGLDLQTLTVADVMTRKPRVIGPDKLTAEAVEMMDSRKINQLPVVDEEGRLIGALNMHDLFQAKAI